MKTSQWIFNDLTRPLYLVASDKGLQGAYWWKQPDPIVNSLKDDEPGVRVLAKTVKQLEEYLEGRRKDFDLPIDLVKGTDFQKSVWRELSKIPYGETLSYADIAKKIKNEKAVRAVGSANGKNPISIIVPCHRVIASSGDLAGYAGTPEIKRYLLDLEKRN